MSFPELVKKRPEGEPLFPIALIRRIERDTSKCALAAVAPGVRFNALAIFVTGALRAIDLRVFTSFFVHSRRTVLFFVLAAIPPIFGERLLA
jgi:hypothetical protein